MEPFLSVIIPTFNRVDKLRECLLRLNQQTLARKEYEILVVNDGSTDGTEQLLETLQAQGSVRALTQKNQGQGIARNKAIEVARGEVILFIGDDIYASPHFLEEHHRFHKNNFAKNAVCLGLTEWDPNHEITPFMRWMEDGGYQFDYKSLLKGKKAGFWHFYTSNISLKKSLLKKHPFDTEFKGYGWEDIELGLRLQKEEHITIDFTPGALAHHDHYLKEEDLEKKMASLAKNAKYFKQKHPEVKVIPTGLKKWALLLIGSGLVRSALKPFTSHSKRAQEWLWYSLAKHYFLKNLA